MLPVLFKIGSFEVHSFGVILIIAFLAALYVARRRAPRYGIEPNSLSDLSFWILISGVLGARLLFLLQEPPKDWHEYFSLKFAGLTSFGALIGGFIVILFWCARKKVRLRAVLDVFIVPLLLGHAIGRFGCLLNGCCFGGACPADLPWGIHAGAAHVLSHPAQVYDSLMNLAAIGIVLLLERRNWAQLGQIFAIGLALHGLTRFIYEFWRGGTEAQVRAGIASSTYISGTPITQAQVASAGIVVLGAVLFFVCARKPALKEPLPA